VVGLVGGLAFLPFQGAELSVLAIGILSITFAYSMAQLTRGRACAI